MANDVKEPEVVKPVETAIAVVDNSTLMALQRAEIDQAIITAKAYPRDIAKFKDSTMSMATLDQETAASMFYTLPRDGKTIQGPSIRLAEIAGSCWGNVRYGSRVIEIGDDYLTARGATYDLERNVAYEMDVRRRIVNREGRRFNHDMIQTTGLAACAIALRNAIFKVVPMAYVKPVVERAMQVAGGSAQTLEKNREAALEWFKKRGVKSDQVFALLGVKSKDEISLAHIAECVGIRAAIKDGEASLADFFQSGATNGGEKPGAVSVGSLGSGTVTGTNGSMPSDVIRDHSPKGADVTDAEVAAAAAVLVDNAAKKTQAAAKADSEAKAALKAQQAATPADRAQAASNLFED